MTYALDTNIVSYMLREDRNKEVVKRFRAEVKQGHGYVIPPLCYYEITWWLLRKKATAQMHSFQELYKNAFIKVSMNEADFHKAAQIRADLDERGQPIGKQDNDIFIAAYCINHDFVLVTNNLDDFKRIDGLKLVNWKE